MLRVNRSTYYKHFSSPESPRAKEDKLIKTYIRTLHGKYKILVKFQINLLNLSPAISRISLIENLIRTNQTEFGLATSLTSKSVLNGSIFASLSTFFPERLSLGFFPTILMPNSLMFHSDRRGFFQIPQGYKAKRLYFSSL